MWQCTVRLRWIHYQTSSYQTGVHRSSYHYVWPGNFSGPKNQEIVAARGSAIELLRPDDTGKVISICFTPLFSVVRSLLPFRLAGKSWQIAQTIDDKLKFILVVLGSNKDYIVIGSDSGKISIVEYDAGLNDWKPVHCEVFGKSGCRRIVPGQYLAADPKGRALIIG